MQVLSGIKTEFSDYDIRRVRYFYTCLVYEISKFVILGAYFYLFGLLPEYLFSVLFVCPLRILTGGLHFQSYAGCLLFSILYFSVSIMPLFDYCPARGISLLLLLLCAVINVVVGPITSNQRPELSMNRKVSIKKRVMVLFVLYLSFFFIFEQNRFFYLANRLLLIHTVQMVAAFIRKEIAKW